MVDKETAAALEKKRLPQKTIMYGYDPSTQTFKPFFIPGDWIIEAVAPNVEWKAPFKCEVFCAVTNGNAADFLDLNDFCLISAPGFRATGIWVPWATSPIFRISNIDPVTGNITDTYYPYNCKASHGWMLTIGEGIKENNGNPWKVRYRRVG